MNLSADLSALGMTGRLYKLDKLDELYFSTPLEDQNTYLRQAGFTNFTNLINFTYFTNSQLPTPSTPSVVKKL